MGVRISKNLAMGALRLDDYEEVVPQGGLGEIVDYKVLRNRLTGNEMEEYSLQFGDMQEYQDYYDAYYWRLSQDHVVRTLHFIDNTRKQFCSTTYNARLYIQRIPMKLSDIKDIPYPDNLYVLLSSLDGFDRIVQKTGYFEIEQYMICINKQGEVKVWLNDNLSRNYPDVVRNRRVNSEEEMVRKLIGIIDGNTDKASQPSSLAGYIYSQVSNPSFGDAMLLVREYARENRIEIPTNFECILEVLNNSRYPTQHTHSDHTISHHSNIRSSVPFGYQTARGNHLSTPNFNPRLVTAQIHPRISEFSRVSHQIPSNSRFHVFHQSMMKNPSLVGNQQKMRQVSTSPVPVSMPAHVVPMAAPSIPLREYLVSPQKIEQLAPRQEASSVARRTNFSPKKTHLPASSSAYPTQHHSNINQRNQIIRHPTPSDARQITRVQHRGVQRVYEESVNQNYEHPQPKSQNNSYNYIHIPNQVQHKPHQNILIQNKEQQSKARPTRKPQSKQERFDRSASPHNNLTSQFINPFFEEEDSSPHFTPQPYLELRIQTRQDQSLQIQTSNDLRNEQQLEEIKRNKAELLKQAKMMVNKMTKESQAEVDNQYTQMRQEDIHYQGFNQATPSFNQKLNPYPSKRQPPPNFHHQSFSPSNYPQNNSLIMSFERRQPSVRRERAEILVYHSSTEQHQIDPEIARDLLALNE